MERFKEYILGREINIYKIDHKNLLFIIFIVLCKLILNSVGISFILLIIFIVFKNLIPLLFFMALLGSISLEESLHFLFANKSEHCRDVVIIIENISFLMLPLLPLGHYVKFTMVNKEKSLNLVKIFLFPPLIPMVIIFVLFVILTIIHFNLPLEVKTIISYILSGCFVLHLLSIIPIKIGGYVSDGYTLMKMRKKRR